MTPEPHSGNCTKENIIFKILVLLSVSEEFPQVLSRHSKDLYARAQFTGQRFPHAGGGFRIGEGAIESIEVVLAQASAAENSFEALPGHLLAGDSNQVRNQIWFVPQR